MAQRDGVENAEMEPDFDIEDLPDADREAFLKAVKDGAESVELPGLKQTPAEPPVPPAPEAKKEEAVAAPAAPEVNEAKPEKAKPRTLPEALAALNTAQQKLAARERVLDRLGKEPDFAKTWLQERGHKVQIGQDPQAVAMALEAQEHLSEQVTELHRREIQNAATVALTHADTQLLEYGADLSEPFTVANAKWEAVWAELGGDTTKLQKYFSDPEFRKTVVAKGPNDLENYLAIAPAIREWMKNPDKPLQKFLDFHDAPRKAKPAAAPAAPAKPAVPDPAFAEAQRLNQRQEEPQVLPNSSAQPAGPGISAIEDLLAKAEEVGTDNLSQAERDRIRTFYADARNRS